MTGRRILSPIVAWLSLALAGGMLSHVSPAHAQTLATPINNAESTLAQNHANGSGTLVLQAGDGAQFGTPSPAAPIRVTVAARSTLVGGQIRRPTTRTIYLVTARTGDTLTGLSVPSSENTASWTNVDRAYAKNDPVVAAITAGAIADIHAAIAALPTDATVVKLATPQTITAAKTIQLPAGQTASNLNLRRVDPTVNGKLFQCYGVQGNPDPEMYIDADTSFYTRTAIVISADIVNSGTAGYRIVHGTTDSGMLMIQTDLSGPGIQVVDGGHPGARLWEGLDVLKNYRICIDPDGKVWWGNTATKDVNGHPVYDVNLYRPSADILKTDDTLIAEAGFRTAGNLAFTGAAGGLQRGVVAVESIILEANSISVYAGASGAIRSRALFHGFYNPAQTVLWLGMDGATTSSHLATTVGLTDTPLGELTVYPRAAGTVGAAIKLAASATADALQITNSADAVIFRIRPGGAPQLPHLADAAAAADSWYYSTDAGAAVFKDPAGVVHALY